MDRNSASRIAKLISTSRQARRYRLQPSRIISHERRTFPTLSSDWLRLLTFSLSSLFDFASLSYSSLHSSSAYEVIFHSHQSVFPRSVEKKRRTPFLGKRSKIGFCAVFFFASSRFVSMLFRLFSLTTLVYTTLAARQTPHDRFISRAVSNSTTPTNSTSALNSTVVGSVWDGESTFGIVGHSGVGGMQISVVDDDSVNLAFLPATPICLTSPSLRRSLSSTKFRRIHFKSTVIRELSFSVSQNPARPFPRIFPNPMSESLTYHSQRLGSSLHSLDQHRQTARLKNQFLLRRRRLAIKRNARLGRREPSNDQQTILRRSGWTRWYSAVFSRNRCGR